MLLGWVEREEWVSMAQGLINSTVPTAPRWRQTLFGASTGTSTGFRALAVSRRRVDCECHYIRLS